jgi:hypothetical protein
MSDFLTGAEYKMAVQATVSNEFEYNNLGKPAQVHLVEKHTLEGYLFFIAFVHFECEPLTQSSSTFRYVVASDGETLLSLRSGRYWRVKKYLKKSDKDNTLHQQNRLSFAAPISLMPPRLTRNGPTITPSTPKTLKQAFREHLAIAELTSAKEVFGDPNQPVPILSLEWPPACFDEWIQSESPQTKIAYEDAIRQGQNSIVKQYHEQARAWEASGNIV